MESEETAGDPAEGIRRLHPSSLIFRFAGHLKPFVVPLVLALVFAGGDNREAWFVVMVGPLMLFELVRYFTFRYRFTPEGVVVREGVLFRNERLVPFARIQNLETRQGVVHRLLGVVDVRVETATGSEPEAKLTVIARERLAELEQQLKRRPSPAVTPSVGEDEAPTPVPAREVYRLPLSEAALLGLSPWKGLAIVGVGIGLFAESEPWERLDGRDGLRELKQDYLGLFDLGSWWIAVALAIAAAALLVALSVAVTVVRLYDFRVERRGARLRVTTGLFTRHVTNLETARIQTVTVRRPWLLRRLKRASIRISTAATVDDVGDESAARQWFAPVVKEERLAALLAEIDPRLLPEGIDWQSLAPSAPRRFTVAAVRHSALLSVPLVLVLRWKALPLIAVLLLVSIVHARKLARRSAYARTEDLVLDREGVFTHRETFAFVDRVQAVGLHESPFDRRHGTVQVRVDTAGGSKLVPAVRIPYLERERAGALRDELLVRVGPLP